MIFLKIFFDFLGFLNFWTIIDIFFIFGLNYVFFDFLKDFLVFSGFFLDFLKIS